MQTPLRVVLFGASLHTGNMGCRALAQSLVKILTASVQPVSISLIYGHPASEEKIVRLSSGLRVPVHVINHRLNPRRSRFSESLPLILLLACVARLVPSRRFRERLCARVPVLRAVWQADFIGQITGGDSFSDIYGFPRFLYRTADCFLPVILGKKYHFLPQTYGPFRLRRTRWLARFLVRHASAVYCREEGSLATLKDLLRDVRGAPSPQLCPDVAFCLDTGGAEALSITPPIGGTQSQEVIVGINISGLLWIGGYSGQNMFGLKMEYPSLVRSIIDAFLQINGTRILLVPHTFGGSAESDEAASRKVFSEYAHHPAASRIHLLEGSSDPASVKKAIGNCGFFVGSRMHACVAAVSQCIPCAAIAYSDKFRGVFSVISAENLVLDARSLSTGEIVKTTTSLYRERRVVHAQLQEAITLTQGRVVTALRGLLVQEGAAEQLDSMDLAAR